LFDEAGYTALTPSWPDDDPNTVEEANADPDMFAHRRSARSPTTLPT